MSRLCEDIHKLFTKEVLESLFSVNIFTINDFLKVDIKKITASSGLSYKDAIYLKKQIANKYAAVTRNGLKYYKEILTKSAIISSGIKSLDILLDGGFLTGQLYEICGLPASGKTQLCLTIAKHIAGSFKKVYYLDSKMDFTGRRLKEMLENTRSFREAQIPDIMSNILIISVHSRYDLISAMYKIKKHISNSINVRVVIVDSLPALFHDGLANFGETNSMLNHFANIARFLAVEFHLIVVTTNILTTWFDGDFKTQNKSALVERICLGKYWTTVPNQRLLMKRKGNENECVIKSYHPELNGLEKHCNVVLGVEGVT